MDLVNYGLRERYEQIKKRGDRLDDIKRIIDWEGLIPSLKDLFNNDTEQGGRPSYDGILMVRMLLLQGIYSIVDESMETEIYSNIRFINFLDHPDKLPDQNTIWLFKERLSNTGRDSII
ncbi:MAG: transposase [Candidatus Micrarchaeaceae archaeon]